MSHDRGAGSVLAVGLVAATVLLTGAALPALAVLAAQQGVQNAADAAALAAADTLSGRASGYPCENAARAASLNGASVADCASDGLIAAVTASRRWGAFDLSARARAGPPGSVSEGARGPARTGWVRLDSTRLDPVRRIS